MTRGIHNLEHWNRWLSQQFLGHKLMEAEQKLLSRLLKKHFGKQALLIGVPQQKNLLDATLVVRHSLLGPLITHQVPFIESDFHELPILTGSVDLVILPHTLELVDNPRHLLTECCRIIKPEGLIAITGINPMSFWGMKKWSNHLIQPKKIKHWLGLADFELEKLKYTAHRPPINHSNTYQRLHFMENIFNQCLPFMGGLYVLLARAKVTPLTPIRMKWKQKITNMRISTTMTGHIARQIK